MQEALIAFAVMLGLTFLRLPIAFSMAIVGFLGYTYMVNATAALRTRTWPLGDIHWLVLR